MSLWLGRQEVYPRILDYIVIAPSRAIMNGIYRIGLQLDRASANLKPFICFLPLLENQNSVLCLWQNIISDMTRFCHTCTCCIIICSNLMMCVSMMASLITMQLIMCYLRRHQCISGTLYPSSSRDYHLLHQEIRSENSFQGCHNRWGYCQSSQRRWLSKFH